jgi:tryptophan-rich sensory protein
MSVAVAATTVAVLARRTAAGALMLPYLVWVTFATALTYEIWRRNR